MMASPECKPLFDQSFVICHLTIAESPGNRDLENPGAEGAMSKRILYNSNRQTVAEYLEALEKITREFRQKSDAAKPDGVYAISIALTPTTNKDCYK